MPRARVVAHLVGVRGALDTASTATAVAGRLIGINPFDQPDVESAKAAARDLLEQGMGAGDAPAFVDGAVEVRTAGPDFLAGADTLEAALQALVGRFRY